MAPRLSLIITRERDRSARDRGLPLDKTLFVYRLPLAWDEAIAGWQAYLKLQGQSPATRRVRRDYVRTIANRSAAPSPKELTGPKLLEVCSEGDYSLEHMKAVRASVRSFYQHCIKANLVTEDISEWLPRVKTATPSPRPATDAIWEQLIANAQPRERLMARLAGEAGLRRAEVAKLKREDLITDRGGWSLRILGKGGKQRVVPITPNLATEIENYCAEGYVFPGTIDGHLSVQYVGQLISKLMPDGWSMHKLRHRYATKGYAGTGNLRAVQRALGHASVATTERYTAVTDLDVRAVSEAAAGGAA